MNNTAMLFVASVVAVSLLPGAFADTEADLEFAGALEETLGHFWAIELNLDERNAQLAAVHATHPIAELYDSMKPVLQDADPALDARFQTVLLELKDKASVSISRDQAQEAVDDAKELVETVRDTVINAGVSADPNFRLLLMKGLLETSIAEYGEAVTDGAITEAAEFQDGSAFVWRSQQIFNEIKSDVDGNEAQAIEGLYEELWVAYDEVASSDTVKTLAGGIIHEIDEITGTGDEEGNDLLDYVETIKTLLTDAKSEYRQGNTDLALSYATKAYLDNYEFLEGPLADAGERELMGETETLLREELRSMIKAGAPTSQVDAQVDAVLEKIDTIEDVLSGAFADRDEGDDLLDYVETIKTLLTDAKSEYRQGNTDLALSYATKAYLDNYEFLEGPLVDAGERELMEEVEILMREELRQMIRDGAPVPEVDEQIDLILIKMDTVEMIVPEFGAVVMVVLVSAVAATVAISMRSRLTNWA